MGVEERSSEGRATSAARSTVRFGVLGPLEVRRPTGEVVSVRRAKPATVLAVLLTRAGEVVAVDELFAALWGDVPPESAPKTLQTYIGQVRSILEPDRDPGDTGSVLRTEASGYRLDTAAASTDAGMFEHLVGEASGLVLTDAGSAAERFTAALRLWRGPPYSDFAFEPFAASEIRRLEALHLTALEGRIDARVALGESPGVLIPELRSLLQRHPLSEHLWAQLMRVLYAGGRQADALAAFASARDVLASELGVGPGPELALVEQRILTHALASTDHDSVELADVGSAAVDTTGSDPEQPGQIEAPGPQNRVVTFLRARCEDLLEDRAGHGLDATIERFGGTVQTRDSGGVCAVFGAPRANEDDAERAVRAAFALQRWAASTRSTIGIGVATGHARVDNDNGSMHVVADPVTTRTRFLAGLAAPGEILVDDPTVRITDHTVGYRPMDRPGVWLAEHIQEPRHRDLSMPFVGRDAELDLLTRIWALTVQSDRSHVVTVAGPAGIGKSRLVAEFASGLEPRGARVLMGCAYSFGDPRFGALAHVLVQLIGLHAAGSDRTRRSEIEEWLTRFLPAEEEPRSTEYATAVLSVLGDVAEDRASTTEALRNLIELAAARQPTVVVFDDIHRAHPDLLDLLEALADTVRNVPLLIVMVTRSSFLDDRPDWATGPHAGTRLFVDALSPDDTRQLTGQLFAGRDDARDQRLSDAAGGNPLFLQALTRWQHEVPGGVAEVPTTVRKVIEARLDRLPGFERRTLTDAAVVGPRFWAGPVTALAGTPSGSVDAALSSLERKGLVVRELGSVLPAERAYLFRHDLVADVAYGTLPTAQRTVKHELIARWLSAVPEAPPALLADHWRRAAEPARAADELIAAGDAVNRGPGRERAVSLYEHAAAVLDGVDPGRARSIDRKKAIALQARIHAVLDS